MVILGADLHKRWHTVVAVSETGRKLGEKTVRATPDGHLELRRWAGQFPDRHVGARRLPPPFSPAGSRPRCARASRSSGCRPSSWPASAARSASPARATRSTRYAVAQAALREPDLPVATLDGPERELRLLVDHREDLVGRADAAHPAPALASARSRHRRAGSPLARPGGRPGRPRGPPRRPAEPAARLARDIVGRMRELTVAIRPLEREIETLVAALAPTLLALPGCGPLTAAKIVGEAAGISRFRSKEAFARHNGSAPCPDFSRGRWRAHRPTSRSRR